MAKHAREKSENETFDTYNCNPYAEEDVFFLVLFLFMFCSHVIVVFLLLLLLLALRRESTLS